MAAIPEKLYYKIGEVARITKVKPYILRYWESEFKIISPKKSLSKQRVYSRRDVELILEIKKLLYAEKFTLEGAKKKIVEFRGRDKNKTRQLTLPFSDKDYKSALTKIKTELASIRELLSGS